MFYTHFIFVFVTFLGIVSQVTDTSCILTLFSVIRPCLQYVGNVELLWQNLMEYFHNFTYLSAHLAKKRKNIYVKRYSR